MYYAIFDKLNNQIMSIGLNCTAKKDIKQNIINLFTFDFIQNGEKKQFEKMRINQICKLTELEVLQSNKKFIAND